MLEQREHLKTSPKVRLRPPRWSPTAGGFLFWASGILPSQFLPRFGINLLIFAPFRHGSVTVISALATSAFAGRMCHHTALHKLTASKAINTGHPGSISTIHADSPALALERLAMMVMRAGLNQTRQVDRPNLRRVLHLARSHVRRAFPIPVCLCKTIRLVSPRSKIAQQRTLALLNSVQPAQDRFFIHGLW